MIKSRKYKNEDYEQVIKFLQDMYLNKNKYFCWLPQRWEYSEYNCNSLYLERGWDDWKNYIGIWEEAGKIIGVCHKETKYNAFLQINDNYYNLIPELVRFAEKTIKNSEENKDSVTIFVPETATEVSIYLKSEGYIKQPRSSSINVHNIQGEYIPKLHSEYELVNAKNVEDALLRFNALNAGFHPSDSFVDILPRSFEMYESAPTFKKEFEIMTRVINGELSSFSTVWYDSITKTGKLEPVCTKVNHRKKGLAKSMIIQGISLLQEAGATKVYVETSGEDLRTFYNNIGFETIEEVWPWVKEWNKPLDIEELNAHNI